MKDEDLSILVTLYQKPNLTKAAELLYMTQPTLTRRIQQMEKEFQVQILCRSNKGVIFTEQGEYLAKQAGKLLKFFSDTKETVLQMEREQFGIIRIAVANSYGQYTLPALLKEYKAIHPNIQFEVITTLSDRVLRLVKRGDVSAGIIRGEFSYHGAKNLLNRDKCYIFSKTSLTMMDLPFTQRVTYPLSTINQMLVDDWWHENFSIEPTVGYHVSNLSICREMVKQGLGYGVSLVEDLDLTGQFFHLPMSRKDGSPVIRNTWLIQSDDSIENPIVQTFVDFLLSVKVL